MRRDTFSCRTRIQELQITRVTLIRKQLMQPAICYVCHLTNKSATTMV